MSPSFNWLRVAIFVLSANLIGLAFIGGAIGYSPVPYWDMWGGTLQFVQRFDDDPIRELFAQHNEHRIVLSRLLFLIDYHLFGGTSAFLVICNYVFAAAIWVVFARCLLSLNVHEPGQDRWVLVAILGAWLFLWAQKVNFTWAFQSQFFLAQLIPLLAFLSLSRAAFRPQVLSRWFMGALILGGLSPFTMANGLIVFPIMILGAVLMRMSRIQIGILVVCASVAISLYLSDYRAPAAHGSVLETLAAQPVTVLHYTFTYLGNPGVYIAGSSSVVRYASTFAGLCLAAITLVLTIQSVWRRHASPVSFGLLLFIIFVGAGAFTTAAGRVSFGIESAFSSRYTTPVLMAWAALFCIASPHLLRWHHTGTRTPFLTFGATIVALCLLMVSQARALAPMHPLNHQKEVAALALGMGIGDDTLVALVHPNTDRAMAIAQAAARENLGIYGKPALKNARESIDQNLTTSSQRSCAGDLEFYEIIDDEPGYVRIYGWQFRSKTKSQSARLYIVDADAQIVGVALRGRASPHLIEAYGPAAARSGFTGYLKSDVTNAELIIVSDICQSATRFDP
jgi:hypothetical protein